MGPHKGVSASENAMSSPSRKRTAGFRTEPLGCEPSPSGTEQRAIVETEFEKRRGISSVEIRRGFVRVHVSKLPEPIMDARLNMLQAITAAGVSIDFLKFTQSGATFMAPEPTADKVRAALDKQGFTYSAKTDRCIVLVDAVNMRDEEGLIASLVSEAISSGARIDHLGDMHDRLLIVTDEPSAEALAQGIRSKFMGGAQ